MKIVFLNIWDCTVKEPSIEFLREHTPDTDMFCLQEAYENTQQICAELLPEFTKVTDYKFVSERDNFFQVTYTKNNLEVISNKPILSEIPGIGLGMLTRIRIGNVILNICNMHGISKPGDKLDNELRILQSQSLIKLMSELEGTKVIGGDFNLEVGTQSVKLFEEAGYNNLIKDYGITNTRNRLVWEKYPETKQYYSDYVFVDQPEIVTEFLVPDIEVSDHLPMILKISL